MTLKLYAHPFSSYCQKVLIALREYELPFELQLLEGDDSPAMRELTRLWPLKRFPVLADGDRTVVESTCIIEYLGLLKPGEATLIPEDPLSALEVRMMDRFFDNYISTPLNMVVFNAVRPVDVRDAYGVSEARKMLETAYAWLDSTMRERHWAIGDAFTLADCGAGPFLFYADWVQPIADRFLNVLSYRARLLEHPSIARAVDEARPYRSLFPLDVPDRGRD